MSFIMTAIFETRKKVNRSQEMRVTDRHIGS